MTREWGLVALSCAIMVLAGTVVFGAVLKAPFNVGSMGQWASAIGTVTAVWVALRNTTNTIKATETREAARQADSEKAYIMAVAVLCKELRETIELLDTQVAKVKLTQKAAKRISDGMFLDGLVQSLDKLPLHLAPDPFIVRTLSSARTAAHNAARLLEDVAGSAAGGTIDVKAELDLINDVVRNLQLIFGALKIDFDFEFPVPAQAGEDEGDAVAPVQA